ncbi:hypothetical protein KDL01_00795 [Actinospica durhamensis]|uniref:Phenylacetate--CoA ligase family protein n=1 Tax=Actinospica durhamensis TaxID=1508375 RepID=A0A941EMK4_9ACTN|nr:hypothetical protein [Actinospica durhamensis]MBR7831774.1 hypothetical protein [Actinospica durhamensis]
MEIDELVERARTRVPYYRERYAGRGRLRLEDLEILDKPTVMVHAEALREDDADPEQLIAFLTSGTTGNPLPLFHYRAQRARCSMALWGARRWYGVSAARAPWCRFRGLYNLTDPRTVIEKGDCLEFYALDLSDDALAEYFDRITRHRPVWLQGRPCATGQLATWMVERGLVGPDSLRLVELTGELTITADREAIARAFPGAAVADQYGSQETWPIAYQCPEGNRHVFEDNVLLEIEGDTGEEKVLTGHAIVTNRHFTAMPLLRYRTGDIVTLDRRGCRCPRGGPVITTVHGRAADHAVDRSGGIEYTSFFQTLIDHVEQDLPGSIRRFQFVQQGLDFAVTLEPGARWAPECVERVGSALDRRFPGRRVAFEVRPTRAQTAAKYRPFIKVADPSTEDGIR